MQKKDSLTSGGQGNIYLYFRRTQTVCAQCHDIVLVMKEYYICWHFDTRHTSVKFRLQEKMIKELNIQTAIAAGNVW